LKLSVSSSCRLSRAIANALAVKARQDKLRAMCEAQCASMRDRLERRVNRVPATKRGTLLVDLLVPPAPAPKPAQVKAAPVTKAAATIKKPAATTTTSKTRTARANTAPSKPTTTKQTVAKPVAKQVRGKKRGSDEIASEDKENAALEVNKKRARAPAAKPAPAPAAATKATSTRATRAASRQNVLSPKKATKSNTRPR
jgi:hypothetical protein